MTHRETLRWRAFDTHGVLTTRDAEDLGVPAVEMRKLAARGALANIGYGVYRMSEVPSTALTEYAEAVALIGPDAVVADESVLAVHHLAQVNPRQVHVVVPRRTRATPPATVRVTTRPLSDDDVTDIEGVPTMTVAAAIRACRGRVRPDRLLTAVDEARSRGLLDTSTAASLRADLDRTTDRDHQAVEGHA